MTIRAIYATILLAMASPLAAASGTNAFIGYVVPLHDIIVDDAGHAPLPSARSGDLLPVASAADDGYIVLCRDRHDAIRFAFLPNRDLQGRETARAWTFDRTLPEETLTVTIPAELKPAYLALAKGDRFPVVASSEYFYTVLVTIADTAMPIKIGVDRVRFELPPETILDDDPWTLREEELERDLDEMNERVAELTAQIQAAEEGRDRLFILLSSLNATEIDATKLRTDLTVAEQLYANLADYQISDKIRTKQQELLSDIARTKREIARLIAQRHRDQLGAAPLTDLHVDLRDAETNIVATRTETALQQSALRSVADYPTEDERAEKSRVHSDIRGETAERADGEAELGRLELSRDALVALIELLREAQSENERLRNDIESLKDELANLMVPEVEGLEEKKDNWNPEELLKELDERAGGD